MKSTVAIRFSHTTQKYSPTTLPVLNRNSLFLLGVFLSIALSIGVLISTSKRVLQVPDTQHAEPSRDISLTPTTTPAFNPQLVSFEQLFSQSPEWVATLSAQRLTTIIATGDVLPARTVNKLTSEKNDWLWPFALTAEVLRSADLTFINLETPLIRDCPIVLGGFTFCGDQRNVQGLLFAGVDVVTLANNHANNYGVAGITETINLLEENEISVVGIAGQPVLRQPKLHTFAFLGYNDVGVQPAPIAAALPEQVKSDIRAAKHVADVVIVQFHWGEEYRYQPTLRQQDLGHLAIDAGADVVIGNHPHWFQAVERYGDGLIAYSHGNFVFDQEWSLETKQGIVGTYTFYDDTLIAVQYLPILIEDYGQAHFLQGEQKTQVIEKLQQESDLLRRHQSEPASP